MNDSHWDIYFDSLLNSTELMLGASISEALLLVQHDTDEVDREYYFDSIGGE